MNYQAILDEIHQEVLSLLPCGTVATYIPQLASVSPQKFGMAVQTVGRPAKAMMRPEIRLECLRLPGKEGWVVVLSG